MILILFVSNKIWNNSFFRKLSSCSFCWEPVRIGEICRCYVMVTAGCSRWVYVCYHAYIPCARSCPGWTSSCMVEPVEFESSWNCIVDSLGSWSYNHQAGTLQCSQTGILISQPVHNVAAKFQLLYPCFQALRIQWNYSWYCVSGSQISKMVAHKYRRYSYYLSLYTT